MTVLRIMVNITRLRLDSLDGLLGLVDFGVFELHPWQAKIDDFEAAPHESRHFNILRASCSTVKRSGYVTPQLFTAGARRRGSGCRGHDPWLDGRPA